MSAEVMNGETWLRWGMPLLLGFASLPIASAHSANSSGGGGNHIAYQRHIATVAHVVDEGGEALVAGKSFLRGGISE